MFLRAKSCLKFWKATLTFTFILLLVSHLIFAHISLVLLMFD